MGAEYGPEQRLACPCGTVFTSQLKEPCCPSCDGVLVVRYKRGTSPAARKRRYLKINNGKFSADTSEWQ
jgi:hypothetical protein